MNRYLDIGWTNVVIMPMWIVSVSELVIPVLTEGIIWVALNVYHWECGGFSNSLFSSRHSGRRPSSQWSWNSYH